MSWHTRFQEFNDDRTNEPGGLSARSRRCCSLTRVRPSLWARSPGTSSRLRP